MLSCKRERLLANNKDLVNIALRAALTDLGSRQRAQSNFVESIGICLLAREIGERIGDKLGILIATRGLALAADAALAALIFLTVTAVVGFVVSLVWDPGPSSIVGSGIGGAGLLFEAAYFAGFWSTAGQTPGMRMMQLRVVNASGSPPSLGRSLVRLVGLGLAILLLFTGFLPVLVDRRRRALQDFLAGTTVVYAEHAPQAVTPPSSQALDSLRQGA